jgi:hypothetical protein
MPVPAARAGSSHSDGAETPLLSRRTELRKNFWPETRLLNHTLWAVSVNVFNKKSALPKAWRVELSIPFTAYSCSSSTYTVVGLHALLMFLLCPESIPEYPQQAALIESTLVALQGFWSYSSDVDGVGMETYVHCVDRFSAIALLAFQLYKWTFIITSLGEGEKAWIWLWTSVAIFSKLRGYRAIIDTDLHAFRIWHIMWHFWLPLAILAFHQQRWSTCEACSIL